METPTRRKLAAILSADVAGYSRLMGADEEGTIEALTASRAVFFCHVERRLGRVVDAKGDAILAEFGSVVDAVSAAVDIQEELAERGADMPEERRMRFRIGINLGDVVVKDDVIYGDGVNVAARLEALADPGGICVSRAVHDQVRSRLGLDFEYLGEQQVKNIAEPVAAYRIAGPAMRREAKPAEAPGGPRESPSAAAQPSLAVLPFTNMSGDADQDYFSDGLTEDLITDLSRLRRLTVIARNSVFVYKDKPTDVRQVGQELGVRYVLEGSVRRAGQNLRITAQLVDARNGDHLWAERYDRTMEDIFALQDEITQCIAAELEVKLLEGEQARVWRRLTGSPEAYDLTLRGRDLFRRYTLADTLQGRQLLERAVALDPAFSYAVAELGWTYVVEGNLVSSEEIERCYDQAIELGLRAVELDDTVSEGYSLLGSALRFKGDYERAIEYGMRAVALNPNDTDAILNLSQSLIRVGRAAEAVTRMEGALGLVPNPPGNYLALLGSALRSCGRHEEAIPMLRQSVEQAPQNIRGRLTLLLAYMDVGETELARDQARAVLRINPEFRASTHPYVTTYRDPEIRATIEAHLRDAGLPA